MAEHLKENVRGELKHVQVPAREVDLSYFPDFLIVGPQRTGTNWLYDNLRRHPEIFMTVPKELYFFSQLKTKAPRFYKSSDLDWYLRFFKDTPKSFAIKTLSALVNYGELYRPKVRGEASAGYSIQDPDILREILLLNPEIKIILMIRNPIDRAWSHAKKDLVRKFRRKVEDVPEEEFVSFLKNPYQVASGRYAENIEKWSSIRNRRQLFIGFYDAIVKSPVDLLMSLYEFLGVSKDEKYISMKTVERIANPAGGAAIPDRYRSLLETLFLEDLKYLRENYGQTWTEQADGSRPPAPSGPPPLTHPY